MFYRFSRMVSTFSNASLSEAKQVWLVHRLSQELWVVQLGKQIDVAEGTCFKVLITNQHTTNLTDWQLWYANVSESDMSFSQIFSLHRHQSSWHFPLIQPMDVIHRTAAWNLKAPSIPRFTKRCFVSLGDRKTPKAGCFRLWTIPSGAGFLSWNNCRIPFSDREAFQNVAMIVSFSLRQPSSHNFAVWDWLNSWETPVIYKYILQSASMQLTDFSAWSWSQANLKQPEDLWRDFVCHLMIRRKPLNHRMTPNLLISFGKNAFTVDSPLSSSRRRPPPWVQR